MRNTNSIQALCERSLAAAALVIASPILFAIGMAVLLFDGWPAFFGQTRVGRHGAPFRLWKFRTMRAGVPGTRITAGGDRRVTRLGALLRKHKLDELPQLWNVAAGHMALIGPRPEVPVFVDAADPMWTAVLAARPGITDLATILYRDEEDVLRSAANAEEYYRDVLLPRKLALNLQYDSVRCWRTDLELLWLSVRYSLYPGGFDAARVHRRILSKAAK
jgi:lipopolysaccharide/colanic/teichoic acid biosynthesis glycosyltransferase